MPIVYLPWLSAIINLVAFILYAKTTLTGTSKPVATSWGIWAFGATINALNFSAMTTPLAGLQFISGAVGCIAIFLVLVFLGELKKLNRGQWFTIAISITALVVWKLTTATAGNLILVAVAIYSFLPTIRNARENPLDDWAPPWALWTLCSLLTFLYNLLDTRFTFALAMPTVLVLGHGFTTHYLMDGRVTKR